MNGPTNPPRPTKRRVKRMTELERRVERLESEVEWLRRSLDVSNERNGPLSVGGCPNCSGGVLMRYGDELRCDTCGYGRFL